MLARGHYNFRHVGAAVEALKKVQYSSRFAAAFFFEGFKWPYGWTAHYFDGGEVRYVSHDSGKRGAEGPHGADQRGGPWQRR